MRALIEFDGSPEDLEILLYDDTQRDWKLFRSVHLEPREFERLAIRMGRDPHGFGPNLTLYDCPVVIEALENT